MDRGDCSYKQGKREICYFVWHQSIQWLILDSHFPLCGSRGGSGEWTLNPSTLLLQRRIRAAGAASRWPVWGIDLSLLSQQGLQAPSVLLRQ